MLGWENSLPEMLVPMETTGVVVFWVGASLEKNYHVI
jgi:hypothetical protein